jgi:hypothetical protein
LLRRSAAAALGVETAGYVLAGVGLLYSADGAAMASLACAVVGVMAVGTALRPDRRAAAYVGTGFLLAASWLRLIASDITVVEAYTAPFSAVLVGFGWWRARGRQISSWVVYGPGLASTLVPSTFAVLMAESGGLRPLLLGLGALAVTLAGARLHLQAPALLGGSVLAIVAIHELAPWIARLPSLIPLAAGGLLLVLLGATYEARVRDARKLRAAVLRMR